MAVHYALVARDSEVIAEFSEFPGEFSLTAKKLLKSTEKTQVFKTYTQGNKTFNFYTFEDLTFLCYSDLSLGRELNLKFLDEMRKSFPAYTRKAGAFAEVIKKLISQYSPERLHEVDKFAYLENNLSCAVESTKSNIGKVIERGTKINHLMKKTDNLNHGIKKFTATAKSLRRKALKQKLKALALVFILGVLCIYIFFVWIETT